MIKFRASDVEEDEVAELRSRRRLRSYLIATFLPLAVLPLVLMTFLSHFFVTRIIHDEIKRRAVPERAALARNIDGVENRVARMLDSVARQAERRSRTSAVGTSDPYAMWRPALEGSPIDEIRLYGPQGELVKVLSGDDRRRLLDQWRRSLGDRQPATERSLPGPWRTPASNPFGSPQGSLRLEPAFRRLLLRDETGLWRDFSSARRRLEISVFRRLGGRRRAEGFVEGKIFIDADRLAILSAAQSVDLAFMAPDLQSVIASREPTARAVAQHFTKAGEAVGHQGTWSVDLEIINEPVAFTFAPMSVGIDDPHPAAIVGLGLPQGAQLAVRNGIVLWIGVLAAGMSILILLLTLVVSRRMTRPLSDLVDAVEAMRAGEWVQPVQVDGETEIGYLVKRFNEMAQAVQVTKRTLETKLNELNEAHSELTHTQGQLVQSAKLSSLGQLVAGVAHELNNPIAFIYSNLGHLRGYLKDVERLDVALGELRETLPAEARQHLEQVLTEIEWEYLRNDMNELVRSCLEGSIRVKDIVLGLRNFSRLDEGTVAPADMNEALRTAVKLLASELKNRIEVHWELCPQGQIDCHLSQMNQVFVNLIANAAQAIRGKGEIWIGTRRLESEAVLEITIRDSGEGIAPEHLDRIFDPFFTTKKVGQGTGLGLSIVYGIVQKHQGTLTVSSHEAPHPSPGTEFVLRLPLRAVLSMTA